MDEDSWENILEAKLGSGLVELQQLLWPDMPLQQRRYMVQHVSYTLSQAAPRSIRLIARNSFALRVLLLPAEPSRGSIPCAA